MPNTSVPALPERIGGLAAVAANLSWSWNRNARALFRALDPALWRRTQHNPIELLRRVAPERLAACAADPEFLRLYDVVAAAAAHDATSAGTWFASSHPESLKRPVAYFCAEFGLHASVPIYSGGLGVLAGTSARRRRTWASRSSASACSIPRDTRISDCASTDGRKTPRSASTWPRHRCNGCAGRRASPASPPCGCPGAT